MTQTYQEYITENKTKLNLFCENYFIKYFNSDKLLITEERFMGLINLISIAENDISKFKRMFLFDYLSELAEKEEYLDIVDSKEEAFENEKLNKMINVQGDFLIKVKKINSDLRVKNNVR